MTFFVPPRLLTFLLCSEAYVHGIMDGEFMEKDPVIKEFTLC